jgi:NADH-quinone oxidoreductase subunit M
VRFLLSFATFPKVTYTNSNFSASSKNASYSDNVTHRLVLYFFSMGNLILFYNFNLLEFLIASICFCIVLTMFLQNSIQLKLFGVYSSILFGMIGFYIMLNFNLNSPHFQFFFFLNLSNELVFLPHFGIDTISLLFILLTTVLFPIVFIASFDQPYFSKLYLNLFFILELALVLTFSSLNIFFFFFFFECAALPMFFIINLWGSQPRKRYASYYFVIYTLFGSTFMTFALLFLKNITGSLNYYNLTHNLFDSYIEIILFFCFFLAFSVKVPMYPFHIWLPEAHVEAPTTGSTILASLLLKLGGYGLIRWVVPLFCCASIYFQPFIMVVALVSIIYAALVTIRQLDLKKIIAYSSIVHMNFGILGLASLNSQGLAGFIILMIAHGFVSGGLFLLVGILYDRYHTRLLHYYGGLALISPIFITFFFFFILGNVSFPGTLNFLGELFVLVGLVQTSFSTAVFCFLGIILNSVYCFFMFSRLSFGTLKIEYLNEKMSDLKDNDIYSLFLLISFTMFLGLNGDFLMQFLNYNIIFIINNFNYQYWTVQFFLGEL